MKRNIILATLICLLSVIYADAQSVVYNEIISQKINSNKKITKTFLIKNYNKIGAVSLRIKGYDFVKNNILPRVNIKINEQNVFSGTMSAFEFGKNSNYGTFVVEISGWLHSGNNRLVIENIGNTQSYIFLRSISIEQKNSGETNKTLKDFNNDNQAYTNYLRNAISLESTVVATENYQQIKKGMTGIYYGEFPYNPNFCCVKWNKTLNKNVTCTKFYPEKYKRNAYNVPFACIKLKKSAMPPDKKPPQISTINNYAKTATKEINISGTVFDESGIYGIFVNNFSAKLNKNGNYNFNLPLKMGQNTVHIKAIDNFGNVSTETLYVTRQANPNDKPPKLEIFYPVELNTTVSTNRITIRGQVSDNQRIDYVKVIENSKEYKVFFDNNKQFQLDMTLLKGKNYLQIIAFDCAGNTTKSGNYTIDFNPEIARPTLALQMPKGLSESNILEVDKNTAELPILLSVNSKYPIANVSVVYVNTPVTQVLTNKFNSKFSGNITLPTADQITIKIIAKDIHGTESKPYKFIVKRRQNVDLFPDIDVAPIAGTRTENCFALVIGNADYNNQASLFNDLPYAKNDAQVFRKYLINTIGVPSANITYRENINTMNFMNTITNFVKKIEAYPNSKFIFYYSGHGALSHNYGAHIVPTDYNEATDNYGLIKFLVIDSVIYKMMEAAPDRLTVFFDMCYGGRTSKGVEVGTAEYSFDGPVVIFNASEAEAFPFERRNHSLFTYALLKVLNDTKGDLTYKELEIKTKEIMNKIIATENLPIKQEMKRFSSSILDDTWENWKLIK